jgi:hypothetical protein
VIVEERREFNQRCVLNIRLSKLPRPSTVDRDVFVGISVLGDQEMRERKNEASRVKTLSLGINKSRRATSDN